MTIDLTRLQYQYQLYKSEIIKKEKGVPTAVHFQTPLHLQESFTYVSNNKINYISKSLQREIQ